VKLQKGNIAIKKRLKGDFITSSLFKPIFSFRGVYKVVCFSVNLFIMLDLKLFYQAGRSF